MLPNWKKIKRTNKGEAKPTVRTFAWEWVQTKVSLLRVAPCNDDPAFSKYKWKIQKWKSNRTPLQNMFWQGKEVLRCNSSLCRWFSGPKPTNICTRVRMFEGWHFYSGGIPLTLVSPPQGISPHIDSLHSPTVSTSDSTSKSSAREMEERCLVIFFCRGNSFLFFLPH